MYVERPCDISNRLAFRKQLRGNLYLIGIELARPTEAHPTTFRCIPTSSGPLANQIPLELGDAGKNRHDHLAGMCRGVGPRLGNRLEFPARLIDRVHRIEEIACGSSQAV